MEDILETSTFIEIFHSGVLVHDDFMDRDNIRRGVETLNSIYKKYGEKIHVKTDPLHYGNSMAVSVGDATLYMSWETLLNAKFPPERIIEAGKIYAKYVIRLAHGQVLDITSGAHEDITEKEVLNMVSKVLGADVKTQKFYKGAGCSECHMGGYAGRVGLYEVLEVTEKIRQLTSDKSSADLMQKTAIDEGMITMAQDGINKVAAGLTTIDEVLRVVKED